MPWWKVKQSARGAPDVALLTALLAIGMPASIGYEIHFGRMPPSSLAYLPPGVTGFIALTIIGCTAPERYRTRGDWLMFLWGAALVCVILAVAGYAIMRWLYGDALPLAMEIAIWLLLVVGAVAGPLIAWNRGKSFEWPDGRS